MPVIISCGEALVDFFSRPDMDSPGKTLDAIAGGSPFNVAVGLARLGIASGFLGGVSRDWWGDYLKARMRAEGIVDEYVERLDGATALSFINNNTELPRYSFYGDTAADRRYDLSHLPAHFPKTVECLNFGSYSLIVEPCGSALRTLMQREAETRLISYDVNVRPTIEPDMRRWRALVDDTVPHVDIIKASSEDIALLYPGVDLDEVASRWQAQGAAIAIITLGHDGAFACSAAGMVARPAATVALVDTVGAGDSFQAALLTSFRAIGSLTKPAVRLISNCAIAKCLDVAIGAAGLTCSRQGPDLPRLEDVSSLAFEAVKTIAQVADR